MELYDANRVSTADDNNTWEVEGIVPQKWKCTHHLLNTMPMKGWVKCLSPQNIFGVYVVNSVAAKSTTIEVTGDSKRNEWI